MSSANERNSWQAAGSGLVATTSGGRGSTSGVRGSTSGRRESTSGDRGSTSGCFPLIFRRMSNRQQISPSIKSSKDEPAWRGDRDRLPPVSIRPTSGDLARSSWLPTIKSLQSCRRRLSDDKTTIHLPLTQRETYTIIRSWKSVHKEVTQTGMRMFVRMFETNPQVKTTFEKFRQMDTSTELLKSSVLFTHAMVVMSALEEIIGNLDDEENVIELVLEQGRSHARFGDDLNENIFWAIEEPFLMAVKDTLKERYTSNLERLYKKTIKFVLSTIVFGFQQSHKRTSVFPDMLATQVTQLQITSS